MKALTLHQPFAELVSLGVKRFETRSWKTNYRGLLAIHSSRDCRKNGEACIVGERFDGEHHKPILKAAFAKYIESEYHHIYGELSNGGIECVVWLRNIFHAETVADHLQFQAEMCRRVGRLDMAAQALDELEFGDYSSGRYAWHLQYVCRVNSFHDVVRGNQGLWNLPADVESKIWPDILKWNTVRGTRIDNYMPPKWQIAERSEAA